MALIKAGKLVRDRWRFLADDESLPTEVSIVISLERWLREQSALLAWDAPLGIRLKAGQHPKAIAQHIERFALIALEFPKFTDGRPYSYARLVRQRYRYRGELRATGQVLRDQLLFMHRCGFDAFEIVDSDVLAAWCAAFAEISVFYQRAADRQPTVLELRHRRDPTGEGYTAPAQTKGTAA